MQLHGRRNEQRRKHGREWAAGPVHGAGIYEVNVKITLPLRVKAPFTLTRFLSRSAAAMRSA